jgi:hypothetical protein
MEKKIKTKGLFAYMCDQQRSMDQSDTTKQVWGAKFRFCEFVDLRGTS